MAMARAVAQVGHIEEQRQLEAIREAAKAAREPVGARAPAVDARNGALEDRPLVVKVVELRAAPARVRKGKESKEGKVRRW